MRTGRLWIRTLLCIAFGISFALLGCSSGEPIGIPRESEEPEEEEETRALTREDFVPVAPQGFGDRQNSWAWSMEWFQGGLVVGTNRAYNCIEKAAIARVYAPFVVYPPEDPDIECEPDWNDLPLQAEIWRWEPETDEWNRVFRSPRDVPIPQAPEKNTSREMGFRNMHIHEDTLYASSVSPRFLYDGAPGGRILRSTDGVHFAPVPQDPGTFLGELENTSFRGMATYKGRLYVIAGGILGPGLLIESEYPERGNDSYRTVSPEEVSVFEMAVFNGYLYVATDESNQGFRVLKTDASGDPPYTFELIIDHGGDRGIFPNKSALSMKVFKGRLYVGGNGLKSWHGAEVFRVNPDDSWEVVQGRARLPEGEGKLPLTGLGPGFSWPMNAHMWRMEIFEERLYLGTFDISTTYRDTWPGEYMKGEMGFDFYVTEDGVYFTEVDRQGFQDKFNFGIRSFQSTSHGLFLGTANYFYGLQIWKGIPKTWSLGEAEPLPLRPPRRLEVEITGQGTVLSWEGAPEASVYRVYRFQRTSGERNREHSERVVGVTEEPFFIDTVADEEQEYIYYLRAEDELGDVSGKSNFVSTPPLGILVTFRSLFSSIDEMAAAGRFSGPAAERYVSDSLGEAHAAMISDEAEEARSLVHGLRKAVGENEWKGGELLDPLGAEDLEILLGKLEKRIHLVGVGVLKPAGVL